MKTRTRNIPSLDGLRALSIGMVLISHLNVALVPRFPAIPPWLYGSWGFSGVAVFFVISGFLITHILLKELNNVGTISLKRFYFRRAFRIFPPFYLYLIVAGILVAIGLFQGTLRSFIVAATYTWNYLGGGSVLLEHTWSLSLEEQFYLLWPAALILLGRRKSSKLAFALIFLSPLSRVASYFLMPHHRAFLVAMLHTRVDTIMFGCLMALLWTNERFERFTRPLANGWVAATGALYVLVAHPILQAHLGGTYNLVLGLSVEAAFLSIILLYAVRVPASPFGRLLNTAALRHIGVISYSLYLWQQIFTRENSAPFFPWNLLPILICAELSYWLVERPSFRLRDRLERIFNMKEMVAVQVAYTPPSSRSGM